MKHNFTIPKIVSYQDLTKPWYVYFRFDGKLVRKKYGINYAHTFENRMYEATILRDLLEKELNKGWNPFVGDLYAYDTKKNVIDAVKFALDKKEPNISENTKQAYGLAVKFFNAATKKLHLQNLNVLELKRIHVKAIFEQIRKDRSWSNKSYNKNLGYIKAVFSELIEHNVIENNPAHGIKSLKVGEIIANTPATDKEVKEIKKHLLENFPSFYLFVITIFHTGIRPKELLSLQLSMINLEKNEILLSNEITKTGSARIVPINKHLKVYFENLEIDTFPKDFYLFGTRRVHSNRGLNKELDFLPAPKPLDRDCASKLWRKLVKDDLEIEATLYSMKHLGAHKKILAGMELDTLRELYGHTSQMMTLRYAKNVKEVYRKQIMENSPDF